MSTRRLAASAALVLAGYGLTPSAAYAADTGTTLYVNGSVQSCTDTGTGTAAAPFCTLQAGVNAAVAGDTVEVASGPLYAPVTISNSGTAAAPITIKTALSAWTAIGSPKGTTNPAPAFTINGASYVTVSGFRATAASYQAAVITNSHDVTLNDILGGNVPNMGAAPAVEVAGTSSNVTVGRSTFFLNVLPTSPVIQIDAGSSGDIVSTNEILYTSDSITTSYPALISVTSAPNTAIANNTVDTRFACSSVVDVAGASGGTSIENNIFKSTEGKCLPGTQPTALIVVTATAAAPVTSDYNILYPLATEPNVVDYYNWNGVQYGTTSSFTAATGEGVHDLATDPKLEVDTELQSTSPAIGSANSSAPGMLSTDINGNSCTYDPYMPITGAGSPAYCTRGAVQNQGPTLTVNLATAPVHALGVSLTDSTPPANARGYSIAWGDGTTSQTTTATTTHEYVAPGTYPITETVTDQLGGTASASTSFTTTALGGGRLFDTNRGSNGAWWAQWDAGPVGSTNIAQAAVTAMPDNDLQAVAVTTAGTLEHAVYYSASKTWQSWGLPKNNAVAVSASIAGMPNGSSQLIEVTSEGTLEHTVRYSNGSWQSTGWGSPAGSTGIAQATITAMPDGSSQLVAVTTSGVLEHNIRSANGHWQGWRTLNQPGVKVTDASIAGMPNGSSQIIEVTSSGVLKHDIRNANGSWQPQGWGSPAGSTSIVEASITAMPDGSSQFVAVTTGGVLEHNIRSANGSWQAGGWGQPVQTDLAAAVTSPGIAGLPNGSAQLIEVSTN